MWVIRDVAQMVAHLVWDQGVAGSSPVIPTIFYHMELVKSNCLICGSKATRKINDETCEGFFFLCEKEECKKSLEEQLFNH